MSEDYPQSDGENIADAICSLRDSIDGLSEMLSEKLDRPSVIERVFLADVPLNAGWESLTLTTATMRQLDPAYHWKIAAERVK